MDRPIRLSSGRASRLLVAAIVAAALLGVHPGPASACVASYPPFVAAASTAQRVVIGDVTAVRGDALAPVDSSGRSGLFTLRVRAVLRGNAPGKMTISRLETAPCSPFVEVRKGDRIVLAFDATGSPFGSPGMYNAVAWIRGAPSPYSGGELIAESAVYGLLGLDPPDTATDRGEPSPAPRPGTPLILVGLLVLAVRWRWFSRKPASA